MKSRPKVIILGGKRGLLGMALSHIFKQKSCYEIIIHGKEDFDVLDFPRLKEFLLFHRPDIVINSISYNLVDNAETSRDKARELNVVLVERLVEYLVPINSHLVHFSSSLIFDGKKNSPYVEEDTPSPLGFYGKTKLEGERVILKGGLKRFLIIRTSWLFGPWRPNFVQHVIETSREKKVLSAIHDQVGSPTYTLDLALYTHLLLSHNSTGIFHVCNNGEATWCELATETLNILGRHCKVQPITSLLYRQRAKRPPYGVLDTSKFTQMTGHRPRPWIMALREFLFSSL